MSNLLNIKKYKPLLIAVGTAGAYSDNIQYDLENLIETKRDFGLWIKHSPYTISPKLKNVVVQTWKDEDGDDVFLPVTGVTHDASEIDFEFVYYATDGMSTVNIQRFIDRIQGKWLMIYDTYTGIGRKGCYMIDADQDPTFKRRNTLDQNTTRDYASFKVKFKVNKPELNVPLSEFTKKEE